MCCCCSFLTSINEVQLIEIHKPRINIHFESLNRSKCSLTTLDAMSLHIFIHSFIVLRFNCWAENGCVFVHFNLSDLSTTIILRLHLFHQIHSFSKLNSEYLTKVSPRSGYSITLFGLLSRSTRVVYTVHCTFDVS